MATRGTTPSYKSTNSSFSQICVQYVLIIVIWWWQHYCYNLFHGTKAGKQTSTSACWCSDYSLGRVEIVGGLFSDDTAALLLNYLRVIRKKNAICLLEACSVTSRKFLSWAQDKPYHTHLRTSSRVRELQVRPSQLISSLIYSFQLWWPLPKRRWSPEQRMQPQCLQWKLRLAGRVRWLLRQPL